MGVTKRVLDSSRLRTPPKSGFSWIDRRLLRDGFAHHLTSSELLLYCFLCLAADRSGLSFYGTSRIASLLKLTPGDVERARSSLERSELILYREPLYQVLALPSDPLPAMRSPALAKEPMTIGAILRSLP